MGKPVICMVEEPSLGLVAGESSYTEWGRNVQCLANDYEGHRRFVAISDGFDGRLVSPYEASKPTSHRATRKQKASTASLPNPTGWVSIDFTAPSNSNDSTDSLDSLVHPNKHFYSSQCKVRVPKAPPHSVGPHPLDQATTWNSETPQSHGFGSRVAPARRNS
jgi:hypothetical protein